MGFEPMKVKPSDLESDPFDRSGIDVTHSIILTKTLRGGFEKPTTDLTNRFWFTDVFQFLKETPYPSLP